jgi:hypothetical protein
MAEHRPCTALTAGPQPDLLYADRQVWLDREKVRVMGDQGGLDHNPGAFEAGDRPTAQRIDN